MITKMHPMMIPGYDEPFATVDPSAVHSDQTNLVTATGHFNVEEAHRTQWFHASNNPDILTDVIAGNVSFHIGNKETAEEIGKEYEDITGGYFLHELALVSDIEIAPKFSPDFCMGWPNTVAGLKHTLGAGVYNAIPYRNLYENAGSLSMIVDPNMVQVVSTRWIPFDCYTVREQIELFELMADDDEFPSHYQKSARKALNYLHDLHVLSYAA